MSLTRRWSAAKLAYTDAQRSKIMASIHHHNRRESHALNQVSLEYPAVRRATRAWYRERWLYLAGEYERVLPHVYELPHGADDV